MSNYLCLDSSHSRCCHFGLSRVDGNGAVTGLCVAKQWSFDVELELCFVQFLSGSLESVTVNFLRKRIF